jgi:hypothetical protein
MEKLSEVSEALRIAIIAAEKLPEINKLMYSAADSQNYSKAAEYKLEKDKIMSLMPNIEDLKHWKEIIDKHL